MNLVVDTSVIIAVITNEKHKKKLIQITKGANLIAPGSLHWEIGNAFSVMFKRNRISLESANLAIENYRRIPIRFIEPELAPSIEISQKLGIYAYDAYFIQSALEHNAPLLTLDKSLGRTAQQQGVNIIEVMT